MGGGLRRMGIAAAALTILTVAGPATVAFADGGPDRVLPSVQQTGERPGFGDRIQPERPGFGDRIQPVVTSAQTETKTAATTSSSSSHGSRVWPLVLVIGLSSLLGAGMVAASRLRKRVRLAHTG